MVTSAKLRELASIGRALMSHEMIELADQLDNQDKSLNNQADRLMYFNRILSESLNAMGQDRSVDEVVSACETFDDQHAGASKVYSPLFNAQEVTRLAYKLVETRRELAGLQEVNKELAVETPPRSPVKILEEIQASVVGRYSFVEIFQLVKYLQDNGLQRPEKSNLKEIRDLLKSDKPRIFSLNEMKLVHEWGCEQQTAFGELKVRLARAFFNPKAWEDRATGSLLSDSSKRVMLRDGSINKKSFQEGLFSRPDALTIPDNWVVKDGFNQFHVGKDFHTKSDGSWWCGVMFNGLTAAQLQRTLEETLGDLRNLYLQYPEGINK